MNSWFKCAFGAAIAIAALLLMAPPASAQEEGACGSEVGAAYGLCNAYCEAMDCDGDPQATDAACAKVLNKWDQQTAGAAIPCGDEIGGLTSICPLTEGEVRTVCEELEGLGLDFDLLVPGAIDSTGTAMEGSANICVCPDTDTVDREITECFPLEGGGDTCSSDATFQGTDVFTETHIGPDSCNYINLYMFGSWRQVLICDPLI